MPRKVTGVRRRRNAWSVQVRVNGRLYTKTFPLDTPVQEMRKWREDQIDTFGPPHHHTEFALARLQQLEGLARSSAIKAFRIQLDRLRDSIERAHGLTEPDRAVMLERVDALKACGLRLAARSSNLPGGDAVTARGAR